MRFLNLAAKRIYTEFGFVLYGDKWVFFVVVVILAVMICLLKKNVPYIYERLPQNNVQKVLPFVR